MTTFYLLDDSVIGSEPSGILAAEFSRRLKGVEYGPNIFAELCVLDMLLAICQIRDSYYKQRLILKGGHSVRAYVPLRAHRFSYDLDFNIYREAGHKFREIENLRNDLNRFAETRRSKIRAFIALNNQRFHWITLNYRQTIEEKYGVKIPEEPKIEICKDCRTTRTPSENEVVTMIDPKLLALVLPKVNQLDLSEQLSNKLYIIGVTARQRRHFDIFDCFRIVEFNEERLDWQVIGESFRAQLKNEQPATHIDRARKLITNCAEDSNAVRRIESSTFNSFDFKGAATVVSELYSRLV